MIFDKYNHFKKIAKAIFEKITKNKKLLKQGEISIGRFQQNLMVLLLVNAYS